MVLAQIQCLYELPDLGIPTRILLSPPRQLLLLLCEGYELVQGFLVDMAAMWTLRGCSKNINSRMEKYYDAVSYQDRTGDLQCVRLM